MSSEQREAEPPRPHAGDVVGFASAPSAAVDVTVPAEDALL